MRFNQIKREADVKYKGSPIRKNLARQAINLGSEWTEQNINMGYFGKKEHKSYCKSECKKYIKERIDTTAAKEKYGSVILMIILGAIISWVIKRILDKLFPST